MVVFLCVCVCVFMFVTLYRCVLAEDEVSFQQILLVDFTKSVSFKSYGEKKKVFFFSALSLSAL